jgi:hypothetical protein
MNIQRNKSINKATGKVYAATLLCAKYRENGKIKTRVIHPKLTSLQKDILEVLRVRRNF